MIGQNRQSTFQQAKADHDFVEEEQELKLNTELTWAIHDLTLELHAKLIGGEAGTRGPRVACRLGYGNTVLTTEPEAKTVSASLCERCSAT